MHLGLIRGQVVIYQLATGEETKSGYNIYIQLERSQWKEESVYVTSTNGVAIAVEGAKDWKSQRKRRNCL